MSRRDFKSIQPVVQGDKVTLIAIADDGTAWSCRGYTTNHWEPHSDGQQWVQIPSLPSTGELKVPPIKL